jgi:hypothetical protein
MYMVFSIARSVGSIFASAMAGMLLCLALWYAFRLIRHPEWGPPLIIVPIALAFADGLPDSEFLRRSLVFAAILAGPFWIAGLAWRLGARERIPPVRRLDVDPRSTPSDGVDAAGASSRYARYPVITSCICENRRANPGEVKRVARRIWRETLAASYPAPRFAEGRIALRAARAALEGSVDLG